MAKKDRKDERVSLEGLDPEEALKALLKVDPSKDEDVHHDDDEQDQQPPDASA